MNKVAVLAIAFCSEKAVVVIDIADRSKWHTPHAVKFLDTFEDDVFSNPNIETLTIQPDKVSSQLFLDRGYEERTIGGLAFRLTAEAYRERTPS